uniref:C2H2-type domain-containing protein n=1 Tax=Clastoptera arizonana TaxID=38151 RepID=A0A1B6CTT6_9HEMI
MSTGKRLAKRSIIGTRVVAPSEDGLLHAGIIHAVKSPKDDGPTETKYSVRFDSSRRVAVYRDSELIGPGFQSVLSAILRPGQRVYLTYNGREVAGEVRFHDTSSDEVVVTIYPPGHEGQIELHKRLEEVRLLESRKSARLMDQDTDFARLADMAGDRKRTSSHCIDVPTVQGSRKRRPSTSQEDAKEDLMNECTAALVLMSLSCSPHSPSLNCVPWPEPVSPSPSLSDSWRSSTPSPPLSEGGYAFSCTDEGIVIDEDFEDVPKKKKPNRIVFQCTWPGCLAITTNCSSIEAHVRNTHLGPKQDRNLDDSDMDDDHEEEFYYTEVELGLHTSSPPTLSHRDMARPPHEDPEYQKSLNNFSFGHQIARPINIPNNNGNITQWSLSAATSPNSPQKHLKLSVSAPAPKLPGSPTRKVRGETKKCRKVYGMEHRELWCTQCKWKKACSRFGD